MPTLRNVNEALAVVLTVFKDEKYCRHVAPRGISTLEITESPYVTRYLCPMECVMFNHDRNANPFFHFFEALWMIAGRGDLAFMQYLLERYKDYSDDGVILHGAYGSRLLDFDQVVACIGELKRDPHTRRAVVALWQPEHDAGYRGKDMPCNCLLDFKIRDGFLNLVVHNRSNDAIWGAYGSNAVQFAFLLNWMSYKIDTEPGVYVQVSDSMHCYPDNEPTKTLLAKSISYHDPYEDNVVKSLPWLSNFESIDDWENDLGTFFELFDTKKLSVSLSYKTQWWAHTVFPMWMALHYYKVNDMAAATSQANLISSTDWRLAALQWLERVKLKRGTA